MTPKDKAKKLVDQIEYETYHLVNGIVAKQCALIFVEDILNDLNILGITDGSHYEYWNKVKSEINKL